MFPVIGQLTVAFESGSLHFNLTCTLMDSRSTIRILNAPTQRTEYRRRLTFKESSTQTENQ